MFNEIRLIGRLGADPEIRTVNETSKVVTLNVATWESYLKKDGEWDTITQWHRVICWNKAAERCAKLKKGGLVLVTGKLTHRSYEKDGVTRNISEIVGWAKSMPKTDGSAPTGGQEGTPKEPEQSSNTGDDDDLPF